MSASDPDDADLLSNPDEFEDITDALAGLEDLPPSTHCLKRTLFAIERREYIAALKRANGGIGEARRQLGVLPTTFNEKMKRFGLVATDWRRRPPA